jgi:hypothetical protein
MLQHVRRSLGRTPATTHFIYIIIFLLFIIYLMSSINFAQVESIREILNFALGFSSLTLALVAIFQTTLSGSELNKLVSVAKASAEASRTAAVDSVSKINEQAERISDITKNLSNEVETLRSETATLQPALGDILNTLDERLDQQNSLLARISTGTEEARSMGLSFTPIEPNLSAETVTEGSTSARLGGPQQQDERRKVWQSSDFNDRLTVGAYRALYAVALASRTQKPIIAKNIHNSQAASNYLSGCLAGLRAAGVIDTDAIVGAKFNINYCNINDIEKIIISVENRISALENTLVINFDPTNKTRLARLTEIRDYFDNSSI